jgi:predicted enzyme related to lactoylglutathione lyase
MAWVADPVGAAVGLWQDQGFAGSQRANEHGTNTWNELICTDAERATPFYDQVLGLQAQQLDMEGSSEPYTTFNVAGRPVGGTMAPQADGVPPHWNVYFQVDDTDATASRARELGGQEVVAPFDIPGIGRMAVLTDPQGATFNLMQDPAEA